MANSKDDVFVREVRIRDFGCFIEKEVKVPRQGLQLRGRNRSGKTTFLRFLRCALDAQGLGPDAIRQGAESCELFVDLNAVRVTRKMSRNGNDSLKVTTGDEDLELTVAKPQTFLRNLLGSSVFDPIRFFTEEKKRKQLLLEAMPIALSDEQLSKYDPMNVLDAKARQGHGLIVLKRARDVYYEARTAANKEAKETDRVATDAETNAPPTDATLSATALEDAEKRAAECQRAATILIDRTEAAVAAEAKTAKTRARIEALRESAKEAMCIARNGPDAGIMKHITDEVNAAELRLKEARAALDAAEETYNDAKASLNNHKEQLETADNARIEAETAERQAKDLEESLGALPAPPTEAEIAASKKDLDDAREARERVKGELEGQKKREAAKAARETAKKKKKIATTLDGIVKSLDEAPIELMKTADGIEGVTVGDDDAIYLNGKRVDDLSGAEQLKLSIDIAKKLNKAKILIVDKLEALDPESVDQFIAYATEGGWQLIATRVDRGEMVLEPIGGEDEQAAAE